MLRVEPQHTNNKNNNQNIERNNNYEENLYTFNNRTAHRYRSKRTNHLHRSR